MNVDLATEFATRQQNCARIAAERGFGALIVFALAPRRCGDLIYLVNHAPLMPGHVRRYSFKGRGYSALVVPADGAPTLAVSTTFVEDELYVKNVRFNNDLPLEIAHIINENKLSKADVGIVGMDILSVSLFQDLRAELPQVRFFPADDIVMNLRTHKTPYEIEQLKKGAEISDIVAKNLRDFVVPGKTELEVTDYITGQLRELGVCDAFATCQSGVRSRKPYDPVTSSSKVIEDGDMMHMEINGKYKRYMIDVCRSMVAGRATAEQRKILDVAVEILEASVAVTKPGVAAEYLEKIGGDIAEKYGLSSNFTATYGGPATYLGHAIGVGVDEPPVLAAGDKTPLVPGMVLTIEPGIYQTPGGGCRVEDEVLVTRDGCMVLNKYDRKWW